MQPQNTDRFICENYSKFKTLCESLVALSIEESKRKTEQRLKEAGGKNYLRASSSPHHIK